MNTQNPQSAPETRTDTESNIWVGNFDENFTGEGEVTNLNKTVIKGEFRNGILVRGHATLQNGDRWIVIMTEGDSMNGKGMMTLNNKKKETGEFRNRQLIHGTISDIDSDEVTYIENGVPVERPTPAPEVVAIPTSEPEEPNVALADRPITDGLGNVWVGDFDENFNGDGIVTNPTNGAISRGRFHDGDLVDGTWTSGWTGQVITYRNGMLVDDLSSAVPTTAEPGVVTTTSPFLPERAFTFSEVGFSDPSEPAATGSTFSPFAFTIPAPAPEPTPRTPREYINPIKYIQRRDQNLYVRDKKGKLTILPGVEEAIDRVSNVCEELPEEVRRRISALGQGNILFKKIVPADGMLTRFLKRNKQGEADWITMDSKWGETVITIDPFHLPKDDNKIKRTISILATMFNDQKKIEDLVDDISMEFAIKLISGNFDHGEISFSKSLPGVEKIKNAILAMHLTMGEGETLSTSNILVLMHGQKREDYANGKYKIIIECDTPMDEQQIAEYIRREIDRVDKGEANPDRSSRTPKGVFGKIRNRMGSILLGTGILAGGGMGANYVATHRHAPVAPETPVAPKPPKAPAVKPPEAPAAKPEVAAEKSPATTAMGETVKFSTAEDGVRMGFLKKVGKKYKAIPKFKLFQKGKDGNFSVKRIEK